VQYHRPLPNGLLPTSLGIVLAEMGLFHRLKLKNRFYARLGAFVRAREMGLSEDDARAYALRIHPATAEDLAYEDELREQGQGVA